MDSFIDDIPQITEIMSEIIAVFICNNIYSITELYNLLKSCKDCYNKYFTVELLCFTINILCEKDPSRIEEIKKNKFDILCLTDGECVPISQQLYKVLNYKYCGEVFNEYNKPNELLRLLENNLSSEIDSFIKSLKDETVSNNYFVELYVIALLHSKDNKLFEKYVDVTKQIINKITNKNEAELRLLKAIAYSYSTKCNIGIL